MIRALLALAISASPLAAQSGRGVVAGREVVVTTQTNVVRLVAVDVPRELHGRDGRYEFLRETTFRLIGAAGGTIAHVDAPRPVAIAVAVPVTARAGRTNVGTLRFTCTEGCEPVDVSIVLDVLPRHALELTPARALLGAHAGARVRTAVTLQNAGNAQEHVQLSVDVPEGWRAHVVSPLPLRVDAGASAHADVEIIVSEAAEIGDYGMVVRATPAAGPGATTSFNMRIGSGQRGGNAARPLLEASAALASDGNGTLVPAAGATISGAFLPGVRANGRLSVIRNDDPRTLGLRSLSRLGYAEHNSFLFVTAPTWNAGVGNIGSSNAGLAGSSVWGVGGTAHVLHDRWRVGALVAAPTGRGDAVDGHYVTGDFAARIGRVWGGALFGDLQDNAVADRYARTVSADVTLPWEHGQANVQLGQRTTSAGAGVGWLARAEHRTRTWGFGTLAGHTPGGSAAFGRASHEVQLDGFREVNKRLTVSGAAWSNRDNASAVRARSTGWAITPQVGGGSFGTFALDLHGSEWSGESSVGGFGNGEAYYGLSWTTTVRQVLTRIGGSRGSLSRATSVGDLVVETRVPRTTVFASATRSTRYGSWQLDVSSERNGAGAGIPTRQTVIGGRLDQVPLVPGRAYLHVQLLSNTLSGTGSSVSSQIAGVQVRLTDTYRVIFDGERNGFMRFGNRAAPWVLTTKVEHSIGLPALRGGALSGSVFGDANGDGIRNPGEQGVAGAIVRVDGDLVTTDARGRFSISRANPQTVDIDPQSLPAGWVVPPREFGVRATGPLLLAVVPTSPVEIVLRVSATAGVDPAAVALENTVVILTDSLGRRWTGAPDSKGVLRFDALPPGSYEVSADLSRLSEPLVLSADLPRVRVIGPGALQRVAVPLIGRPMRIVPPPADRIRRIGSGASADGGAL